MSDAPGQHWIDALELSPHPEGGWFRQVYRAGESISQEALPERFAGDRCFSTAIYFLLQAADFSAFHRIGQDELWHFYDGSSVTIHVIDENGEYSTIGLGRDVESDEEFIAVVRGGCLFGATLNDPDSYALVGCTVAPGFDYFDFVMPSRADLERRYPDHTDIIERLTRSP